MRTDAIAIKKDLDDIPGEPHVDLLLDVLIRNAVEHLVDRDVVVVLDSGNFPLRQLIGLSGQQL